MNENEMDDHLNAHILENEEKEELAREEAQQREAQLQARREQYQR